MTNSLICAEQEVEDLVATINEGLTDPKALVRRRIKNATRKRERAQRMLEDAAADLAIATAAGRRTKTLTMKEMGEIAGYGREHLYTLQREHGLEDTA